MRIIVINLNLETVQGIIYMSNDDSKAIYFISVASTLSGIHQQTIRTYEQKGLIKPFRTGGGTRRYSQEDIDKLIQIQNLSQRGINLDGIKIIYEMKDKIEELQNKIIYLENNSKDYLDLQKFCQQAATHLKFHFPTEHHPKSCLHFWQFEYQHQNRPQINFHEY